MSDNLAVKVRYRLGSSMYLYRKNLQGDITEILDSTGNTVVKYVYDEWGNHQAYVEVVDEQGAKKDEIIYDSNVGITTGYENDIGNLNPIRYRSYYYDTETALYYLKARYYDPEVGRFISQDDTAYLDPETLGGINLFAYCCNEPVNRIDPTGHEMDWGVFWRALGSGLAIVGGLALICFVPGAQLIGAGLIITGAGGYIGGGIGYAKGYGFNAGWDVGTLIGGSIGLVVAAPQLLSLTANLILPTFGSITTTTGALIFGITGTVTVSVPVGAIAVAGGLIAVLFAEHTQNKSKSRWDKHSGPRSGGPEKKDPKMKYKKWKRAKLFLPFTWFFDDWIEQTFDN